MSKSIVVWPEEGEQYARQPDVPLHPWPDGSLRQLDGPQRWALFEHRMMNHDTIDANCLACLWEQAV